MANVLSTIADFLQLGQHRLTIMSIITALATKLSNWFDPHAGGRCSHGAADYIVVHDVTNDTPSDMRVFLEMTCEEIYLAPGHSMQLLARPSESLLPLTVKALKDGLQIFPNRQFDPDWHVRFRGQLIKPGYPTRLVEYE